MTIKKGLSLLIIIVYSLIHNPVVLAMNSKVTFAYSLYKEGQVEKASGLLKPLAESGDAHAAYVMGLIALDSLSSSSDVPQAISWFVKSSRGGFTQANLALGNVYQNQWTKNRVFENYKLSKFYYEKSRKNYFSTVKENLETLEKKYKNFNSGSINPIPFKSNSKPASKQPSVKIKVVTQEFSAKNNSSKNLNSLPITEKLTSSELKAILKNPGLLEIHPISKQPIPVNKSETTTNIFTDAVSFTSDYFMNISGSGQLFSLVILVFSTVFILRFSKRFFWQFISRVIHGVRDSTQKNRDNFSSLLPTAKNGDKFAQYSLAQLYENSYEPPESHRKANYWYKLSAEQGYALAQYKLAVNYLYGYGFPRNKENAKKAIHWLDLAVEQNYIIALYELGRCYENGWGVRKDINFALGLYSQASSSGYGRQIDDDNENSQPELHANHNLVACLYCDQAIKVPNILPSSKIRCESCTQHIFVTKDRFGNRQVQKKGSGDYNDKDIRITSSSDAFEILGIKRSSESNEITKAYREKIARYHPDKLLHLGDEFQDIADYKTKKFVSAYQFLRVEGFVT